MQTSPTVKISLKRTESHGLCNNRQDFQVPSSLYLTPYCKLIQITILAQNTTVDNKVLGSPYQAGHKSHVISLKKINKQIEINCKWAIIYTIHKMSIF